MRGRDLRGLGVALGLLSLLGCSAAPPEVSSSPDDASPVDDQGDGGGECVGCCLGTCSDPPPIASPVDASVPFSTSDAGAFPGTGSPGSAPEGGACVTSIDCGGGLVCGYAAKGGCAATGTCVLQVSGPAGAPACGCDGLPVQYEVPGYTSVPVASPLPCGAEAGAGDDAGDASATD